VISTIQCYPGRREQTELSEAKPLSRLAKYAKLFGRTAPLRTAEAFSNLFERAHLLVYRYLYGLRGGPAEEVEDLTAETFMRAWNARERFEGDEGAAVGWLLKIARRLSIDTYRRQKVRGVTEDLEWVVATTPDSGPEDLALASEQHRTLWALLNDLPLEQREMLVLRYLLGWRVTCIAEHLGLAENTVSVTIRRTLICLQREWPQSD
jgi:RNA polymerase sigma-70 factor, ECF subfamily